jgi:Mlc titration factor MtfA (ptsG expression regulator)
VIGRFFKHTLGQVFGRREPAPIADTIWQETLAALPFLGALAEDEKSELRALCEAFLAEKQFTSAGGLELSDAMCVSIAAQGCLPILKLGLARYAGWVGIVVYPDEFVIPRSIEDEFGVVHEYDEVASGEAWAGGPLLISWRDAQMAGDGYNVVIHEFAHKLDMQSGEADGVPPLPRSISREDWEETLLDAWEDFCDEVDAADERNEDCLPSNLDAYGAESPAEFFAVMSEAFFETPDLLQKRFPELYSHFTAFYRQDPAVRAGIGANAGT